MKRLSADQNRIVEAFRERRAQNKGNRFKKEDPSSETVTIFCKACEERMVFDADTRPSQAPRYCEPCEQLRVIGLMGLATGSLFSTQKLGVEYIEQSSDRTGNVTLADLITASELLGRSPQEIVVIPHKDECGIGKIMMRTER